MKKITGWLVFFSLFKVNIKKIYIVNVCVCIILMNVYTCVCLLHTHTYSDMTEDQNSTSNNNNSDIINNTNNISNVEQSVGRNVGQELIEAATSLRVFTDAFDSSYKMFGRILGYSENPSINNN